MSIMEGNEYDISEPKFNDSDGLWEVSIVRRKDRKIMDTFCLSENYLPPQFHPRTGKLLWALPKPDKAQKPHVSSRVKPLVIAEYKRRRKLKKMRKKEMGANSADPREKNVVLSIGKVACENHTSNKGQDTLSIKTSIVQTAQVFRTSKDAPRNIVSLLQSKVNNGPLSATVPKPNELKRMSQQVIESKDGSPSKGMSNEPSGSHRQREQTGFDKCDRGTSINQYEIELKNLKLEKYKLKTANSKLKVENEKLRARIDELEKAISRLQLSCAARVPPSFSPVTKDFFNDQVPNVSNSTSSSGKKLVYTYDELKYLDPKYHR